MRVYLFDLVRVFAIALLLVAHIAQSIGSPLGGFFGLPHFYYVSLGGVAVSLFLVLSGMTIEWSHSDKDTDFKRFIVGRILRIYPTYYVAVILGIIVYALKYFRGYNFPPLSPLIDTVGSITGFYAFFGRWGGSFVTTSWFVGLIMSMYIMYPILSKLMKLYPTFTLITTAIISIGSRLVLGATGWLSEHPLDWFPMCRLFEFSLGIYTCKMITPKSLLWINKYIGYFTGKVISLLSDLSYPIFLTHYPLLSAVPLMCRHGIMVTMSITMYCILIISVSWFSLKFVNLIVPREKIMGRLFSRDLHLTTVHPNP